MVIVRFVWDAHFLTDYETQFFQIVYGHWCMMILGKFRAFFEQMQSKFKRCSFTVLGKDLF
jgi:hypothetical protein